MIEEAESKMDGNSSFKHLLESQGNRNGQIQGLQINNLNLNAGQFGLNNAGGNFNPFLRFFFDFWKKSGSHVSHDPNMPQILQKSASPQTTSNRFNPSPTLSKRSKIITCNTSSNKIKIFP